MNQTGVSVAEDLRQAHATLLQDVGTLEDAARPTANEDLTEFRSRLAATRKHIAEHFRFEEQNGYMDTIRKREPRLERAIEQLAQEHRQLAQALEALMADAAAATTMADSLRERVREWIGHLRQHELRENELVQAAFNLDIGAED
jgi:cell division septum initiation protein DivIVA